MEAGTDFSVSLCGIGALKGPWRRSRPTCKEPLTARSTSQSAGNLILAMSYSRSRNTSVGNIQHNEHGTL